MNIAAEEKKISGWGLYPRKNCRIFSPKNLEELQHLIISHRFVTARGLGKSYGDSSLGKIVISSLKLNEILEFDPSTGVIHCQSGVSFDKLLRYIVPQGFFPPVTPGTKFITVGGAFASDVHGKNHHIDGVFSDHVDQLTLIDEVGNISTLNPNENLFKQTAGGMGKTGYIYAIKFRLKKIETSYIEQKNYKAKNLKHIFELFEKHHNANYSVAWIDCLSRGKSMGRSILMVGESAKRSQIKSKSNKLTPHKKPKLNIPFFFPSILLNSFSISVFNTLYYNNPLTPIGKSFITHYNTFFYPLDKIQNWNRIYGKNGFLQYQFVIPLEKGLEVMSKILGVLSREKIGSFLSVLKLFGKSHKDRYLHFPIEGYTLALDIKISPKVFKVLENCDQIINAAGGKIYLTKDSRMSNETFKKQYRSFPVASDKFTSIQIQRLSQKAQKMKSLLLVIGANSDMAKSCTLAWIKKNPEGRVVLCSRNRAALEDFAKENEIKNVELIALDLKHRDPFSMISGIQPTEVLYAAGVMYENDIAIQSSDLTSEMIAVNYTSAVTLINQIIENENGQLKRIVGISSIAGLRGRKGNYIYGSSKSGFHQYLFGLRQNLRNRGIMVQAITPGFVKTKMTSHLDLGNMANTPEDIANSFLRKSKSFELYPNLKWKIIGSLVKVLPEFLIMKL